MENIEIESWNELIKKSCKNQGFDYYGIAKAEHLEGDSQYVEAWLMNGCHAEMTYMENNKEKRYNPSLLVDNAKTVITVLMNYYPKEVLNRGGNYLIAKYAYGQDYHFVIKDKLNQILSELSLKNPEIQGRAFTDSAPFLDRAWAVKNGLGFIGKNTCLINRKAGSFFLIGQLLLDIELEYPEVAEVKNSCGNCTRCLDACPTGALVDAHHLDSNKCISYLTIEHKGDLPQELQTKFKDWIFGCDICQDVCPWNRFSKPHQEDLLDPHPQLYSLKTKADWEKLKPEEFGEIFRSTAVKRTKYKGLRRNIDFQSSAQKD